MLAQIFPAVLAVSGCVGVLALLIKLLSPVINRRYTPKWNYWVWLILAVRLLVPVHISFSQPPLHVVIPQITIAVNAAQHQPVSPAPGAISEKPTTGLEMQNTPDTLEMRAVTLPEALAGVWAAGGLLFLAATGVQGGLARRRIGRWAKPAAEIRLKMQETAAAMGVKPPELVISPMAASPMVLGLFRPVLVLPHADYAPQDLHFILRHELCHLRRRDLWYKLVLLLANAVHWFNPLVYLLVREANADLERACDSEVVRNLSYEEKKAYSETLLAAIRREKYPPAALSTCFRGGKNAMKARFSNILDMRRRRRGTVLFVVVLLGAALAGGWIACDLQQSPDALAAALPTPQPTQAMPADAPVRTPQAAEEPAVTVHTVVFTGLQTAGIRNETVVMSDDGQIPPQGACRAVVLEGLEMQTLGMQITLPAQWELRSPEEGEAMYNDFCTYSPVNIYRDGVCIGTMGCDRFFESDLELWEAAWTDGETWRPPAQYWGLYWPRMTGNCRWEDLTQVRRESGFFAGTCRVVYEREISGTGKTQANKGILAHDAALGQYCSIELRDDAATAEQWTAIAQSIRLVRATAPSEQPETPVLTAPAAPAEAAFEKTEVTFPVYEQRNGYNDAIFDIAPFQASLYLPEGCAIAPLDEEGKTLPSCRFNLLWSKMGIFRDGKQIGTIGYNVFDDVEQAQGAYIAVYGQIMLGSLVTWNSEYTPVVEAADFRFASATCSLLGKEVPPGVSAAGVAYERCPAVLAYHRDLGVYIGVAFEPNSITAQQQEAIARSVVIQAAQPQR